MTTTTAERADILQQVGPGDAETLRVYTDGLSVYSGTKKHVGAYAVWIAEGHPDNDAWWTREGRVTNQTMELAGVLAGLEVVGRHCVRLGGTAGPGAGPSTSAAASAQFGDKIFHSGTAPSTASPSRPIMTAAWAVAKVRVTPTKSDTEMHHSEKKRLSTMTSARV